MTALRCKLASFMVIVRDTFAAIILSRFDSFQQGSTLGIDFRYYMLMSQHFFTFTIGYLDVPVEKLIYLWLQEKCNRKEHFKAINQNYSYITLWVNLSKKSACQLISIKQWNVRYFHFGCLIKLIEHGFHQLIDKNKYF